MYMYAFTEGLPKWFMAALLLLCTNCYLETDDIWEMRKMPNAVRHAKNLSI